MLVDHDLQSKLVRRAPQVEIHVVQVCSLVRVIVFVGEVDPDGLVRARLREIGIGIFRKKPALHGCAPHRATNARTCCSTMSGCSRCGRWPASGMTTSLAPGII